MKLRAQCASLTVEVMAAPCCMQGLYINPAEEFAQL